MKNQSPFPLISILMLLVLFCALLALSIPYKAGADALEPKWGLGGVSFSQEEIETINKNGGFKALGWPLAYILFPVSKNNPYSGFDSARVVVDIIFWGIIFSLFILGNYLTGAAPGKTPATPSTVTWG